MPPSDGSLDNFIINPYQISWIKVAPERRKYRAVSAAIDNQIPSGRAGRA